MMYFMCYLSINIFSPTLNCLFIDLMTFAIEKEHHWSIIKFYFANKLKTKKKEQKKKMINNQEEKKEETENERKKKN